jgi:hypothetical protein
MQINAIRAQQVSDEFIEYCTLLNSVSGSSSFDGITCHECLMGYVSPEKGSVCAKCPAGWITDKSRTTCASSAFDAENFV